MEDINPLEPNKEKLIQFQNHLYLMKEKDKELNIKQLDKES